jgi:hypothetical protein
MHIQAFHLYAQTCIKGIALQDALLSCMNQKGYQAQVQDL